MTYYELNITIVPPSPWSEIVTAELAELGCDSFVETDTGVQAYGPVNEVQLDEVKNLAIFRDGIAGVQATIEINEIANQNWNARWEADFDPVFVEDKLAILAPFHAKELQKELTIYIEPKMSFGTGHHQTTWMMSKALIDRSTVPEYVLDMGSGTGVLAILAEKLGGQKILAIDIEDWAYENAIDNVKRNNCTEIKVQLGDIDLIRGLKFNLILANINKNVLKEHLPTYSNALNQDGELYLSGFFSSDVDDLVELAAAVNLAYISHLTKDNWACIHLKKN